MVSNTSLRIMTHFVKYSILKRKKNTCHSIIMLFSSTRLSSLQGQNNFWVNYMFKLERIICHVILNFLRVNYMLKLYKKLVSCNRKFAKKLVIASRKKTTIKHLRIYFSEYLNKIIVLTWCMRSRWSFEKYILNLNL